MRSCAEGAAAQDELNAAAVRQSSIKDLLGLILFPAAGNKIHVRKQPLCASATAARERRSQHVCCVHGQSVQCKRGVDRATTALSLKIVTSIQHKSRGRTLGSSRGSEDPDLDAEARTFEGYRTLLGSIPRP